jgi:hypothetical protein
MKTISIKKQQGKILSYKKDGKTFRLYDNILTDDFIKEYLVNGTDEEIVERVKMFNFPVEGSKKAPKEIDRNSLLKLEVVETKEIKRRKKRTPKNG